MKMLKIGLFIFYKLMPKLKWSSQAESNRRPFPYHGNALPTELCEPHIYLVPRTGFEPVKACAN
jgi:hypothetical protein